MLYINNTKYICYAIPCLFVQSHGLKIFQNPPIITTRKIIFLETDNPQTKNKTFGNKVLYYEPMMQKTIEVTSLICNLK